MTDVTRDERAELHALQVYGGTGSVSQADGSSLTPLIAGGTGTPPKFATG